MVAGWESLIYYTSIINTFPVNFLKKCCFFCVLGIFKETWEQKKEKYTF